VSRVSRGACFHLGPLARLPSSAALLSRYALTRTRRRSIDVLIITDGPALGDGPWALGRRVKEVASLGGRPYEHGLTVTPARVAGLPGGR